MNLDTECHSTFYGHQTFHPRFGWLKKSVDAVKNDERIFSNPSAPIELGVGKNMVEAIKFWGLAFGLITNVSESRNARFVPTQFAEAFFGENGLDPYLEDETSLWILHWRALSPKSHLPAWWIAFNDFGALEFTEEELENAVTASVDASSFKSPSQSSLSKDIDCILKMYATKALSGRQTWEDQLDSPFRALGLITTSPGRTGAYRFKFPGSNLIPETALCFASLEYAGRVLGGAKVISLSRLVMDQGGPGRVFKVNQDEIQVAIEACFGAKDDRVQIVSAAGALMLTLNEDPIELAQELLIEHHASRGIRKRNRKETAFAGLSSYTPTNTLADQYGLIAFQGDSE